MFFLFLCHMVTIQGYEIHPILNRIFKDVKGYLESEQLQVCCPRCQEYEGLPYPDGKYNLEINTAKRVFKCWKCDNPNFSGSLGRLIKLYGTKIDYEEYKSYGYSYQTRESDNFNDDEEFELKLPEEMIYFSQMNPINLEHFEAYNYMVNERKISRDLILKHRIGFCLEGKYRKRIIVPSFNKEGGVNYFIARNYDNDKKKKIISYLNPKINKDNIIFNEGYINWDSTVYLVEGVFDMLSIPINTIPILGKKISTKLFLTLKKYKPNIILLLDLDAYENTMKLYYSLYNIYVGCEDKIKILKLPTNEDIDEYRKNNGSNKIVDLLYSARNLTIDDQFVLKKNFNGRYRIDSKYKKW